MDLISEIQLNMSMTKNKSLSAVDKVIEYIKDKIIDKELRAGDKLPIEAELCKLIDVSRGSVREAIKILEASKIVQIRRGDGTYISSPEDITFISPLLFKMLLKGMQINELFDFRESIEMSVLMLAISNARTEDIDKLKQSYQKMQESVASTPEDYMALYQQDIEFHKILADATRNDLMKEIYLFTFDIFFPIILKNYETGQGGQPTLDNHELMINAIEKRNFLMVGHAVKCSVKIWGSRLKEQ